MFSADQPGRVVDATAVRPTDGQWCWIDIEGGPADAGELVALTGGVGLESLAVRDGLEDLDLPKVDDFGDSILVVLHGLGEQRIETFELDCHFTTTHLVTVRRRASSAVDAVWNAAQHRPEVAAGGPDHMVARLADVVTRRLVTVLDTFDDRNEELVESALLAHQSFLGEVMAVRADLATIRRVIHPQREVCDVLRHTSSPLVSPEARRRFSDVFDVATRAATGVDAARTALAETLDAYRGAEARQATEVTKILTFYAAVMLPLSLLVGFFGMNFENLPLVDREGGWIVVTACMVVVAMVSMGVFISLGWARRPSGRRAGAALGRGLVEAARTPVELVEAVYEISTMPLRNLAPRRTRGPSAPGDPEG